jgi:apolipoprotein N-acyltransferase
MAQQALSVCERTGEHPRPARPEPTPAPAAHLPRATPLPRLILAALASSGLLFLCYFPVAWGWLGWVALVPLLALVRAEASPRRIKLCAWLSGSAFFWPVLTWMPVADYRMYYTWAMLAVYCSLYFPVAIVLLRRLDRGTNLPLVITVPAVWVGLEFIRSFLLTGFAWYYLGHTQHDYLAMIQVADLGGAYLVSLLVAAGNAWLFAVLYACRPVRRLLGLPEPRVGPAVKWLAVQGAAVAALIVAALGYGAYRLSEDAFTAGPRLALLQGSIDQRIRNVDLAAETREAAQAQNAIFHHYGELEYLARTLPINADLIVWPETSFPEIWFEVAPQVPLDNIPKLRDRAGRMRQYLHGYARGDAYIWNPDHRRQLRAPPAANVLLGLNARVVVAADGKLNKYNSALLVHKDGALGGRYDKIHRVPFGEYVPLRESLPFMDTFAPYENDYSISAGEAKTRFQLGKFRFGVLICYEDTDPFLARPYGVATDDGPPADFLVNISNDGWFDGSSEHREHLAICRFRAVEARRSVARAVNMGISALIDGNGRVLRPHVGRDPDPAKAAKAPLLWVHRGGGVPEDLPVSEWTAFQKVWGIYVADVPIDHRTSLYSRWGDWLPLTCWAVVGAGLVRALVTRRRRRALAAGGVV